MMNHKLITLILSLCISFFAFAQETITGTIKATDSQPLPGVNILLKGTGTGASTDFDGNFSINAPANGTLVVSFIGFKTQEIAINSQTVIDVVLEEDFAQLDQVVVVGYGTQKKSDVTGAVSSVKMSELQNIPSARADQALQGQVAGVNIVNNDASPDANVSIRVRGVTSISGGSNPLIIIDGVQGASLKDIHPNDIASMEVLKDASATAIYGSRGAAGVILITSKKGKNKKPQITFNSYTTMHQVRDELDLMDAYQYAVYNNDNRAARGLPLPFTNQEIEGFKVNGGTDWQKEIFRMGISHNQHLNVSGGNDDIVYSISGDFLQNDGIIINSSYKKYSVRPNIGFNFLDKKLKFNLNSFISLSKNNPVPLNTRDREGSPVYSATFFPPTKPVYLGDGTYSQPGGGVGSNTEYNPVALALEPARDNYSNRINFNPSIEYSIIEGLKLYVSGAYLVVDDENNFYYNEKVVNGVNADRKASITDSKFTSFQNTNLLTYEKDLNDKHSIKLTGLFEQQKLKTSINSASASDFLSNSTTYNNLSLGAVPGIPWSNLTERSLQSFMGRVNYSYDGKYAINLTGRQDASSVFAENNKTAFFPSVGIAWNVSKENFLIDSKLINNLKLRGSYGEVGNQGISPYESLAQLTTGAFFTFNGNDLAPGVALSTSAPNPDLRWETTVQLNVGLDVSMFNGRLSLSADYYKKNTTDLLQTRALFQASGFATQLINAGEVENKGVEFVLSGKPIVSDKFKWDTTVTFSMNENKVIALDEGVNEIRLGNAGLPGFDDAVWLQVGEPIGLIRGIEYNGVWKSDEAVLAAVYNQTPGSPKYVDQNNDGIINGDDWTNIANTLPDFTYSWINNFSYNNFSLNLLIIGSQGNDIYNLGSSRINSVNNLNVWTPTNENTNIPAHNQLGSIANSSRWVEDGSYLRLKNITLGYNLPEKTIQSLGIGSLRFYLTGTNLITLTDYTGYDPESNSSSSDTFRGIDHSSYPSQKQFTLGLDITF
ncbi:TonB-dependent receptor [Algibacter agarivorans]|uniref:TonB-dependent receptor n=1 Tax=Algibacter agarivorans TaxID=1109741 RepID=A0ABP9H3E6_9FLAO